MVSKDTRYKIFIGIVFIYFVVEISIGIYVNSIALQTDAYHMLSDLMALIVGYIATQLVSRDKSQEYTYGWVRAEIIGGLINSVFLLSICFSILLDVGQRLSELIQLGSDNNTTKLAEEIDLLLIIAAGGLLINLIGLWLFHDHHHDHDHVVDHDHDHEDGSTELHPQDDVDIEHDLATAVKVIKTSDDFNQQAVRLHILGDTLGSIVVILSGLAIKYIKADWKFYSDPIASLLIVIFISFSSINLAKKCIMILMHRSPREINYEELLQKINDIKEVDEIHHFHIWPLTTKICKASLHVRLKLSLEQTHYLEITDRVISEIKAIFHQYEIHSSTIQPEWQTGCLEPICHQKCREYQCCEK